MDKTSGRPAQSGPACTTPPCQPPDVVWWLGIYLGLAALLALAVTIAARANWPLGSSGLAADPAVLHAIYAFCWGALGACLNAALAVARHCADRDFDEGWNWWYLAKPPMGAISGLVVYVLSKGFGSFLGMTPSTTGFGVAAVAFVAGFATERVVRKIDDVSKTLFATSTEPPALSLLDPPDGKSVASLTLPITAEATEPVSFLRAACLEDPTPDVALTRCGDGLFEGSLTLAAVAGQKTIRLTGVCGGQALTAQATIHQSLPPN